MDHDHGFHGSHCPETASLMGLEPPAEDRPEVPTQRLFSVRMWPPEYSVCIETKSLDGFVSPLGRIKKPI